MLSLHFYSRSFGCFWPFQGSDALHFRSLFIVKISRVSLSSLATQNHERAEARAEDRANAYTLQFRPLPIMPVSGQPLLC